jgi:5S rRNA maturation endonuclease (ribonuclease M5)
MKTGESSKHERYEEIRSLVREMSRAVDAVIVEGPHDKKTIVKLGFKGPVFTRSKYSYDDLTDRIAKKFSVLAILTDFDEEGRTAYRALSNLLEKKEVTVNRYYRDKLEALLKEANITTIEGIYRLRIE